MAFAIATAAFLVACYPSPEVGAGDPDAVFTIVEEGADFTGFATYAVPDTILHRPFAGQTDEAIKDLILGDIHRNMEQLGYELEPDPDNNPPDVVVVAGVITRDVYGMFVTWPFFGGFGGYNGWIVGYPPVAPGYVYTQGTVTMDMVDYKNVDADRQIIPVLWSAAISGPLQPDARNQAQRITDGIDRAFAQSPYLKPE